jgi:hypothetical protein
VIHGTFYAYNDSKGLYRTTDGGSNWTLIKSGQISQCSGFNAKIKTVPGKSGHLFFTAGSCKPGNTPFSRSIDGGISWRAIPGILDVYDFGFGKEAASGAYPTVFIAGWVKRVWGVWRSDDDCATWTRIGDFPLNSLDAIKAVEGDPNIYGRVYLGFQGSGYAYGDISRALNEVVALPGG